VEGVGLIAGVISDNTGYTAGLKYTFDFSGSGGRKSQQYASTSCDAELAPGYIELCNEDMLDV
jgi:hypothetical protein